LGLSGSNGGLAGLPGAVRREDAPGRVLINPGRP
jgi:hypothetical protein